MVILNLTQHTASVEQKAAGVIEPMDKKRVQDLLTFDEMPTNDDIHEAAEALSVMAVASGAEAVMIGGAPFLMSILEDNLALNGLKTLYAFSKRRSVEETMADGSVKKTQIFQHTGFIQAVY